MIVLSDALGRTNFHARTAINTIKGVILHLTRLPVYVDGFCRTGSGTGSAKLAFAFIKCNFAPVTRIWFP